MVFQWYYCGTSMVNMNGIPMVLLWYFNGKHEWYFNGITVWYFNGKHEWYSNGITVWYFNGKLNGIPVVLLCGIKITCVT